jgi:hypothetical protein
MHITESALRIREKERVEESLEDLWRGAFSFSLSFLSLSWKKEGGERDGYA